MTVYAVVLAAGRGTRMKSDKAKVLHILEGRPLVAWALDAIEGLAEVTVVVGHQARSVEKVLAGNVRTVRQQPQDGTGHAVEVAVGGLDLGKGDVVLVLPGDMPLLRRSTMAAVLDAHFESGAAATVLTATVDDPTSYGRIIRGSRGVEYIVEHSDASSEELAIHEINTSVFVFEAQALTDALPHLGRSNAQGEKYLTDIIGIIAGSGGRVGAADVSPQDAAGVNSQAELAAAARELRERAKKE